MKFFTEPVVIVDVETTGMSPVRNRITEIACIRFENGKEVKRFVSLINPGENVPLTIQYLTGISNDMLREAPTFEECAEEIKEIFEGALFIAHNVRFDYSFIKAEMQRAGLDFKSKMLCTARLSRKLFPEHKRHNLSIIIERFNFTCSARHRALGDTEVLRDFLYHIDKNIAPEAILEAVGIITKESYTSHHVANECIKNLPEKPGVYRMYDEAGTLLYVGKSVNLRSRVISHFSNTHKSGSDLRLWNNTKEIDFTETNSDLGASILELMEIKTLSPLYNRRSRRTRGLWYLIKSEDDLGYPIFTLQKEATPREFSEEKIYAVFKDKRQAKTALEKIIQENNFCPKTFGLEKGEGACFLHQLEKCTGACIRKVNPTIYSLQIELVFERKKVKNWPYKGSILVTTTHTHEGKDFFLVDQWLLKEYFAEREEGIISVSVSSSVFDYEVYKLLSKEIIKPKGSTKIYKENSKEYKQFLENQ